MQIGFFQEFHNARMSEDISEILLVPLHSLRMAAAAPTNLTVHDMTASKTESKEMEA